MWLGLAAAASRLIHRTFYNCDVVSLPSRAEPTGTFVEEVPDSTRWQCRQ